MVDTKKETKGTSAQDEPPLSKPSTWQMACDLWGLISVEPALFCFWVPGVISSIAVKNFQLEKACRVSFNNTVEVCSNIIDKNISFNILMYETPFEEEQNMTSVCKAATQVNVSANATEVTYPVYAVTELEQLVCQAKENAQQLTTEVTDDIESFETYLWLFLLVIALAWSDRRGLRKVCMLLPMLGDIGAYTVDLLSAIFFNEIPVEFDIILRKVFRALGGKTSMMVVTCILYLIDTTPEKDRLFRIGLFYAFFYSLVEFFPKASVMTEYLGYIPLFVLCIVIEVCGIIHILFVMPETKHEPKDPNELDNPAFIEGHNSNKPQIFEVAEVAKPRSCLIDFFNPIVVVEYFRVLTRKRMFGARNICIFILIMYFIGAIPIFGEGKLAFMFLQVRLNWGIQEYVQMLSFDSTAQTIGTFVFIGGASKILGLPDAWIGFISSVCTAISRLVFANAINWFWVYAGSIADMFADFRLLSCYCILSIVVEKRELGKMFAIMEILDIFNNFASVPIYDQIFTSTKHSWAGAFYILSFGLMVFGAVLYVILYFMIEGLTRKKKAYEEKMVVNDDSQITHL